MAKFIKLTSYDHGGPFLVNFDMVAGVTAQWRDEGETYTILDLGGDRCDFFKVTETPDEILALIEGAG